MQRLSALLQCQVRREGCPSTRYLPARRLALALSAVQTSAEECPGQQSLQPPAARMEALQPRNCLPLKLDIGCSDDLTPFFGVFDDEPGEIGGCHWHRHDADVLHSCPDLGPRVSEGCVDFLVEPVDDLCRYVLGRADADPADCLIA